MLFRSDQGPLAGILSGLIDLGKQRSHYGLFVTCDLWQWHPLWTEVFLKETSSSTDEPLLYSFDLETSDKVSFVPFPCWLHRDCLAILSEDWQIGSRSIRRAFELLSARHNRMPIPREYLPRSFNTPEELERLQDEQRD